RRRAVRHTSGAAAGRGADPGDRARQLLPRGRARHRVPAALRGLAAGLRLAARGGEAVMSVLALLELSDQRVAFRLESFRPPRWLRAWIRIASRLGDGWLWLIAPLVLALEASHGAAYVGAAALAAAIANTAVVVLKRRFRRRRPSAHVANPFF